MTTLDMIENWVDTAETLIEKKQYLKLALRSKIITKKYYKLRLYQLKAQF